MKRNYLKEINNCVLFLENFQVTKDRNQSTSFNINR